MKVLSDMEFSDLKDVAGSLGWSMGVVACAESNRSRDLWLRFCNLHSWRWEADWTDRPGTPTSWGAPTMPDPTKGHPRWVNLISSTYHISWKYMWNRCWWCLEVLRSCDLKVPDPWNFRGYLIGTLSLHIQSVKLMANVQISMSHLPQHCYSAFAEDAASGSWSMHSGYLEHFRDWMGFIIATLTVIRYPIYMRQ
jgi:hypothetical protein